MKQLLCTALVGGLLVSLPAYSDNHQKNHQLQDKDKFEQLKEKLKGYYYDVQVAQLAADVSNASGSGEADITSIILAIGRTAYDEFDWGEINLEAFAAFGANEDTAFEFNGGANRYRAALDYSVGVLAAVQGDISEKFSGQLKLGAAHSSIRAFDELCAGSVCASPGEESDSSGIHVTYSIGGIYNFSENCALSLNYIHLFDDDIDESDVEVSGYSISYSAKF